MLISPGAGEAWWCSSVGIEDANQRAGQRSRDTRAVAADHAVIVFREEESMSAISGQLIYN